MAWHIQPSHHGTQLDLLGPYPVLLVTGHGKTREHVDNNLRWYLYQHLELPEHQPIELPYRTDAFIMRRQHEG